MRANEMFRKAVLVGVTLTTLVGGLVTGATQAVADPVGGPNMSIPGVDSGSPVHGTATGVAAQRPGMTMMPTVPCPAGDTDCVSSKILQIDAAKMPYIARNIQIAFDLGKPEVLRRQADVNVRNANRAAACRGFVSMFGGTCDEYPFASSREGGLGAVIAEVPAREQNCQGGTISGFYARSQIRDNDPYLVDIKNPDLIPAAPYMGQDIAKDKGACE
ncbi:MAG: NucA/NucB deoxyribonuclease domain-containing protein [Pseudonocardia sp.]